MNNQQLENYRQLLLSKREQLEALTETGEAAAQTVELDQSKVGRLSRMDAMQAQAMSIESNRRREQELAQIAVALNKINDGDYGYCVSCDEAIAEKRLEINPAATLCINCASQQE
ncbi:MAG: TraR/DksA family transcriptional regulator [Gammaproteobacteria bacterium]|nr:TraR/DksA family transcriptional regulator [Gammaproteobacteria bacterium]